MGKAQLLLGLYWKSTMDPGLMPTTGASRVAELNGAVVPVLVEIRNGGSCIICENYKCKISSIFHSEKDEENMLGFFSQYLDFCENG